MKIFEGWLRWKGQIIITVSSVLDQLTSSPPTYLWIPTDPSTLHISSTSFPTSPTLFSLAWHWGTGSVASSQQGFVVLGGCRRMSVNLIQNLDLAASFKHRLKVCNDAMKSVFKLRPSDRLDLIAQPCAWLSQSEPFLKKQTRDSVINLFSICTQLPWRCIWYSIFLMKSNWVKFCKLSCDNT